MSETLLQHKILSITCDVRILRITKIHPKYDSRKRTPPRRIILISLGFRGLRFLGLGFRDLGFLGLGFRGLGFTGLGFRIL